MRSNVPERILRFSIVLLIAAIGLGSIERWGYYQGLLGLVACSAICLIAGVMRRNWFLVDLSVVVTVIYVLLSCVTVAQ